MSIPKKRQSVYLDNAASTLIDKRVKDEIVRSLELYGNPSSFNDLGRIVRNKINESRSVAARFLGARPEEIIFTSSGSESNNLAILGVAGYFKKPAEIITTPIEHPSVLEPLKELKNRGWKITSLQVGSDGLVDLEDFRSKLNSEVAMVSVIYANNEIGTIQPIFKIVKVIEEFNKVKKSGRDRILFHTDACQAAGHLDLNVDHLGVDMLTFNGSKIYGPRGAAVLYVRKNILLRPLILGGDQERGLRAGTENVSAIAGIAEAIRLIKRSDSDRVAELRDHFLREVTRAMPDILVNGPVGKERLANNINISIPGLDSENILLELDKWGIRASAGSACTARSVEPSHVLKAIGVQSRYINGALRLSLGRQNTKKDIDYVLTVLPKVVMELRKRYNRG